MDKSSPILRDSQASPDIVKTLADYLSQYPQDIIDAKRLLQNFRVSATEFHQALQLIDKESVPQVFA
jgi:hypothetical protein